MGGGRTGGLNALLEAWGGWVGGWVGGFWGFVGLVFLYQSFSILSHLVALERWVGGWVGGSVNN